MRIGHGQLESKAGDFEANLAKVVKGLERADRDRGEVVCLPGFFLTGYPACGAADPTPQEPEERP